MLKKLSNVLVVVLFLAAALQGSNAATQQTEGCEFQVSGSEDGLEDFTVNGVLLVRLVDGQGNLISIPVTLENPDGSTEMVKRSLIIQDYSCGGQCTYPQFNFKATGGKHIQMKSFSDQCILKTTPLFLHKVIRGDRREIISRELVGKISKGINKLNGKKDSEGNLICQNELDKLTAQEKNLYSNNLIQLGAGSYQFIQQGFRRGKFVDVNTFIRTSRKLESGQIPIPTCTCSDSDKENKGQDSSAIQGLTFGETKDNKYLSHLDFCSNGGKDGNGFYIPHDGPEPAEFLVEGSCQGEEIIIEKIPVPGDKTCEDGELVRRCIDNDGDGYCSNDIGGNQIDCNDGPSGDDENTDKFEAKGTNPVHSFCKEIVCCQNRKDDKQFKWGVRWEDTCDDNQDWAPLPKKDQCLIRTKNPTVRGSLTNICAGNRLMQACPPCIHPTPPGYSIRDGCGIDTNCNGVIEDGYANFGKRQCVLTADFEGEKALTLGSSDIDQKCIFLPGGISGNAVCGNFKDTVETDQDFIGININTRTQEFSCLPESEKFIIPDGQPESRYGELDIEKFISPTFSIKNNRKENNPCQKKALLNHVIFEKIWEQAGISERDKCKDGVDNDGEEDLFNQLQNWGIQNLKMDVEGLGILGGNPFLVRLTDVDDPDCYDAINPESNKPYCFDGDKDGFCGAEADYQKRKSKYQTLKESFSESYAVSKFFPDCDDYEGDDDDIVSDYWRSFSPPQIFFNKCSEYDDRYFQTLGPPTAEDVLRLTNFETPPKPYNEMCKIRRVKKFYKNKEAERKYLGAENINPFPKANPNEGPAYLFDVKGLCGLGVDVNCNKNGPAGYDFDQMKKGQTPFDLDPKTGIESVYGFYPNTNDFSCSGGEDPILGYLKDMGTDLGVMGGVIITLALVVKAAPLIGAGAIVAGSVESVGVARQFGSRVRIGLFESSGAGTKLIRPNSRFYWGETAALGTNLLPVSPRGFKFALTRLKTLGRLKTASFIPTRVKVGDAIKCTSSWIHSVEQKVIPFIKKGDQITHAGRHGPEKIEVIEDLAKGQELVPIKLLKSEVKSFPLEPVSVPVPGKGMTTGKIIGVDRTYYLKEVTRDGVPDSKLGRGRIEVTRKDIDVRAESPVRKGQTVTYKHKDGKTVRGVVDTITTKNKVLLDGETRLTVIKPSQIQGKGAPNLGAKIKFTDADGKTLEGVVQQKHPTLGIKVQYKIQGEEIFINNGKLRPVKEEYDFKSMKKQDINKKLNRPSIGLKRALKPDGNTPYELMDPKKWNKYARPQDRIEERGFIHILLKTDKGPKIFKTPERIHIFKIKSESLCLRLDPGANYNYVVTGKGELILGQRGVSYQNMGISHLQLSGGEKIVTGGQLTVGKNFNIFINTDAPSLKNLPGSSLPNLQVDGNLERQRNLAEYLVSQITGLPVKYQKVIVKANPTK